ncbi:protein ALP1-like [Gastrolobium bilobum]|uniref:protein ALP1-like n=1 Tax=Gastrolobium bilobum TaxID=150636 RepID=UPI002AB27B74|nr:protein ALP1-like [Gastrolobium bilobum]
MESGEDGGDEQRNEWNSGRGRRRLRDIGLLLMAVNGGVWRGCGMDNTGEGLIQMGLNDPNGWLNDTTELLNIMSIWLMMEQAILELVIVYIVSYLRMCRAVQRRRERLSLRQRAIPRIREESRVAFIRRLINDDVACVEQLRMNIYTFRVLCSLVRVEGKLKEDGLVSIEEQVAMFLHILAHHAKNRVIKFKFQRSGETVSRYFNLVLKSVLRLQEILLKLPDPVSENCTDDRLFTYLLQGCLGALDGTYITVNVPEADKPRYRSRKGEIATNVLGVCSRDMKFVYVLPGWEGSASDARVLRDAINRRNGLKVPTGYYYLVDGGYTNGDGFLAPYRETRYHLSEWRHGHVPATPQEVFNKRHAQARNVIERTFGLLKMRWAILRSPSFYPVKTHNRIIIACCLLHNLIRREMDIDPLEIELGNMSIDEEVDEELHDSIDTIHTIDTSEA